MNPEHYQYFRVPARLLLNKLLDDREAHTLLQDAEVDPADVDPYPRTHPWGSEGDYDHEVEVGVEWTAEDYTHGGAYGSRLSRDGEPRTLLEVQPDHFRLTQGHSLWRRYDGEVSGIIERTAVVDYCSSVPQWPAGLEVSALFELYTDEIITLGPQEWARQIGLEGWDWTTERPIPLAQQG